MLNNCFLVNNDYKCRVQNAQKIQIYWDLIKEVQLLLDAHGSDFEYYMIVSI